MNAEKNLEMDVKSIDRVYSFYARFYDLVWGRVFYASRKKAIQLLNLRGGEKILDVGVGTGLSLHFYPNTCSITGIDLCPAMLQKGRKRLARYGLSHIALHEMDAMKMDFPDDSFDAVVAVYTISVVPDPSQVMNEMIRVCKKGGKLVLLNHFKNGHPFIAACETRISPLTKKMGFRADLNLADIVNGKPIRIQQKMNAKPFNYWDIVLCANQKGEPMNGPVYPGSPQTNEAGQGIEKGERSSYVLEDVYDRHTEKKAILS